MHSVLYLILHIETNNFLLSDFLSKSRNIISVYTKRKLGILTDHFFYMVRRPLWKVMKTIEGKKNLFDKIYYNFFIANGGENEKESIGSSTKSVKFSFL